jgi:methionyl-tRNA formyltransferase
LRLDALEVEDVNTTEVVAKIRSLRARLGLVIAFGQKLSTELLASFPAGCINLHASLLPKYRGAAPINWAILRGEEETGCTVIRVGERIDAGPVLVTRATRIEPDETAGELHDRLACIGVEAVEAALKLFESDGVPEGTPQNEAEATRAPKLKKSDGFIRFARPAEEVTRHLRGMTPWPGATARFQSRGGRSEDVAITRARPITGVTAATDLPGTIDARLFVAVQDGFIEILEIRPQSSRKMGWTDFVNGRHVVAGDKFVTPES